MDEQNPNITPPVQNPTPPVNQTEQVAPPVAETPEATVSISEKKSKKLKLVALVVVLIAAAVGGYLFMAKSQKPTATTHAPMPSGTNLTLKSPTGIYFSEDIESVSLYDFATKKVKKVKLEVPKDSAIDSASTAGSNKSFKILNNGKSIFYKVVNNDPEVALNSVIGSQIYMYQDGKATELISYTDKKDKKTLLDWTASDDGSTIYYVVSATRKPDDSDSGELHMFSVSTKKDTTLKVGIDPGSTRNPLSFTNDGALYTHTLGDDDGTIVEHKVKGGVYSSRVITTDKKKFFGFLESKVSPDGKWLLFEDSSSGTSPATFTYYIVDTTTGSVTELYKQTTDEQSLSTHWLPDSKKIIFDVANFGEITFQPRIDSVSIETKKLENVFSAKNKSDNEKMNLLELSSDGKLIAINNQEEVKLYNLEKRCLKHLSHSQSSKKIVFLTLASTKLQTVIDCR